MAGQRELRVDVKERTRYPEARIQKVFDHLWEAIANRLCAGSIIYTPIGTMKLWRNKNGEYKVRFKVSAAFSDRINKR